MSQHGSETTSGQDEVYMTIYLPCFGIQVPCYHNLAKSDAVSFVRRQGDFRTAGSLTSGVISSVTTSGSDHV